jgi:hypothetical protein
MWRLHRRVQNPGIAKCSCMHCCPNSARALNQILKTTDARSCAANAFRNRASALEASILASAHGLSPPFDQNACNDETVSSRRAIALQAIASDLFFPDLATSHAATDQHMNGRGLTCSSPRLSAKLERPRYYFSTNIMICFITR